VTGDGEARSRGPDEGRSAESDEGRSPGSDGGGPPRTDEGPSAGPGAGRETPSRGRTERKKLLLRLDPGVHDALARWASDELRSTNAQIEFLLRRALADAGRLPREVGRMRRPGRPAKEETDR
jgi:hypothetical protein